MGKFRQCGSGWSNHQFYDLCDLLKSITPDSSHLAIDQLVDAAANKSEVPLEVCKAIAPLLSAKAHDPLLLGQSTTILALALEMQRAIDENRGVPVNGEFSQAPSETYDLAYIIATKRMDDQTPSLAKTLGVLYATFDEASTEFQKITADMMLHSLNMRQYYAIHAVLVRVGVAVDREVDSPRAGQPTTIAQLLLDLYDRPRDEWDAAISSLSIAQRQELEKTADGMAQRSVQLSGYVSARGASGMGDSGHSEALKRSKQVLKRVRKAMGYTQP